MHTDKHINMCEHFDRANRGGKSRTSTDTNPALIIETYITWTHYSESCLADGNDLQPYQHLHQTIFNLNSPPDQWYFKVLLIRLDVVHQSSARVSLQQEAVESMCFGFFLMTWCSIYLASNRTGQTKMPDAFFPIHLSNKHGQRAYKLYSWNRQLTKATHKNLNFV